MEVSNNGIDFTNDQISFQLTPHPNIARISPTLGGVRGHTTITVFGSNFVNSSLLFCRFSGYLLSEAVFNDSTSLSCESPTAFHTGVDITDLVTTQEF